MMTNTTTQTPSLHTPALHTPPGDSPLTQPRARVRMRGASVLLAASALALVGVGCAGSGQPAGASPTVAGATSGSAASRSATSSPATSSPATSSPAGATAYRVVDRMVRDLDRDGAAERIAIREPRSGSRPQQLRVQWGGGAVSTASLANTMSYGLRRPVDVDGDGDLDLVVLGGGGEFSQFTAFLVGHDRLAGRMTMTAPKRADLDGDGRTDDVRLLAPTTDRDQLVLVIWGGGDTARVSMPNTMERTVDLFADYDGDGRLEIVTSGGGGEYAEYRFLTTDGHTLVPVDIVDGDHTVEMLDATQDATWTPVVTDDSVITIQFPGAAHPLPATVDVRAWTLSGHTLAGDATVTTGCADLVDYRYVVTPGVCS